MRKYFLSNIWFHIFQYLLFLHQNPTQSWPKSINHNDTIIKIYQPLIESYSGNIIVARGAFSILLKGKTDPVFGALWINGTMQTDRQNRTAVIDKVKVNDAKFAGDSIASNVTRLNSYFRN